MSTRLAWACRASFPSRAGPPRPLGGGRRLPSTHVASSRHSPPPHSRTPRRAPPPHTSPPSHPVLTSRLPAVPPPGPVPPPPPEPETRPRPPPPPPPRPRSLRPPPPPPPPPRLSTPPPGGACRPVPLGSPLSRPPSTPSAPYRASTRATAASMMRCSIAGRSRSLPMVSTASRSWRRLRGPAYSPTGGDPTPFRGRARAGRSRSDGAVGDRLSPARPGWTAPGGRRAPGR